MTKRYTVQYLGFDGLIIDYDQQWDGVTIVLASDYDTAQNRIAVLEKELAEAKIDRDRYSSEAEIVYRQFIDYRARCAVMEGALREISNTSSPECARDPFLCKALARAALSPETP